MKRSIGCFVEMSRSADRAMDTPDVLQKLGRPGFPQGLKVLLVGNGQRDESREIEEQMKKLFYTGMLSIRIELTPEYILDFARFIIQCIPTGAYNYDSILYIHAPCF